MKNYYLLLGLFLLVFIAEAQIPCSLDNLPGCRLCSVSYQGSTEGFTPDSINYDFSCGTVENSQWHYIIAGSDSDQITLTLSTTDCTSGTGIEVAVFDSNLQPIVSCFTLNQNDFEQRNISGVVPGETYYILIDGINGSDCDFRLFANNLADIPTLPSLTFTSLPFPAATLCGVSSCFSLDRGYPNISYEWEFSDTAVVTSGGSLQDTFICLRYDYLTNPAILFPDTIGTDAVNVTPVNECFHGFTANFLLVILPDDAIIIDTIICPGSCFLFEGDCYTESTNVTIPINCGTISQINISFVDTSNFEITCLVDSFTNSIAFNWSDLGADNFDIFINDVFQTTQSFSSYLLPFNQILGDEIKIKVIPSSILGCSFKTSETICKFNNPTNSTQQISSEKVNIFPNPTSNIVEITSEIPIEEVSVFDLSGRLILESLDEEIDLSGYGSGVYFFKIKTSSGFFIKKVIKL